MVINCIRIILTLFTSAGPVPNDNETVFAIQNKGTTDNLYGMPHCVLCMEHAALMAVVVLLVCRR